MSDFNKKIILIYSPLGGTGKSTISINVSLISSFMGLKTLLIDFSTFSTISSFFKLYTTKKNLSDIIDLMNITNDTDKLLSMLKNDLSTPICENFSVLKNTKPQNILHLNINLIEKILETLMLSEYNVIFIDTSIELNKNLFYLINKANSILMPLIQDNACAWNFVQFKEIIEQNNLNINKFYTILNMCKNNTNFNFKYLEDKTGLKNLYNIPFYFNNYQQYINMGYLISSKYNNTAYNDFVNLTELILLENNLLIV